MLFCHQIHCIFILPEWPPPQVAFFPSCKDFMKWKLLRLFLLLKMTSGRIGKTNGESWQTDWKVALYGLLNGQFMTKVNHKTGKRDSYYTFNIYSRWSQAWHWLHLFEISPLCVSSKDQDETTNACCYVSGPSVTNCWVNGWEGFFSTVVRPLPKDYIPHSRQHQITKSVCSEETLYLFKNKFDMKWGGGVCSPQAAGCNFFKRNLLSYNTREN